MSADPLRGRQRGQHGHARLHTVAHRARGSGRARGQEQIDARSELHDAEALPRAQLRALAARGRRSAARGCRRPAGRRPSGPRGRSRPRSARCPSRPRGGTPAETCPADTPPSSRRPEIGARFTWTSMGDRKMLIWRQGPGGAASATAHRQSPPDRRPARSTSAAAPSSAAPDHGRNRGKSAPARPAARPRAGSPATRPARRAGSAPR